MNSITADSKKELLSPNYMRTLNIDISSNMSKTYQHLIDTAFIATESVARRLSEEGIPFTKEQSRETVEFLCSILSTNISTSSKLETNDEPDSTFFTPLISRSKGQNLRVENQDVRVEIKRLVSKVLKTGKVKTAWGVEFKVGGETFPIIFPSRDQTMLYVCTLLRHKKGEPMYIHEFFNNSKGRKSKYRRQQSQVWIHKVYDTIFPTSNREFSDWIGMIEERSGRPLNQGKSQTNRQVKSLLESRPEVQGNCLIETLKDSLDDTFYHLSILPENIILPDELLQLAS